MLNQGSGSCFPASSTFQFQRFLIVGCCQIEILSMQMGIRRISSWPVSHQNHPMIPSCTLWTAYTHHRLDFSLQENKYKNIKFPHNTNHLQIHFSHFSAFFPFHPPCLSFLSCVKDLTNYYKVYSALTDTEPCIIILPLYNSLWVLWNRQNTA